MAKFLSRRVMAVILVAVAAGGCGSAGTPASTPASPSPSPAPAPSSGARVTVTATAYVPEAVTIPVGSTVTFVNGDRINHLVNGGRDPEHLDCPEINTVGLLAPGQSGVTQPFMTARTCFFHDHVSHELPPNFIGSVVIQ